MMNALCDVRGAVRRVGSIGRMASVAVICGALGSSAGCLSTARGEFASTGYTSTYGYEIPYQRGTKLLLPVEWGIDNLRLEHGQWVHKDQSNYVTKYEFDDDGDGMAENSLEIYTYALRYEHRVHDGVIWLREIPIAKKLRSKDLRVLLQSYLDEIAGATYETVTLGAKPVLGPPAPQIVVEQRRAPEIIEQGAATVGGQLAYAVTFDLANIDEVKVAPRARSRRVQLVVLRALKDEVIEATKGLSREVYPVLLLAGYSNMPADFAKGLDDFHGLLRNMVFAGKSGLTLELSPAAGAPAVSGAPPAQ